MGDTDFSPEWRVGVFLQKCPVHGVFLHDVLVHVMQEVRRAVGVGRRKDDVQPDIERLPGVAHGDRVVVQRVQLLNALEAVIDEERPGSQGVVRVHALLHSSSHVVVLERQAVISLVRLDHAVLAVPDLRPAAGGVHGAVGHGAVQAIGEIQLDAVLRGGRVLVEAVRRVGPWHARLIGGGSVADGVVGVGVRVGGVHIRRRARQLRTVVVGVGDGAGIGVCAARAGHGGAPPDGVVDIAAGGPAAAACRGVI